MKFSPSESGFLEIFFLMMNFDQFKSLSPDLSHKFRCMGPFLKDVINQGEVGFRIVYICRQGAGFPLLCTICLQFVREFWQFFPVVDCFHEMELHALRLKMEPTLPS